MAVKRGGCQESPGLSSLRRPLWVGSGDRPCPDSCCPAGPTIPWRPGRTDVTTVTEDAALPNGLLPDGDKDNSKRAFAPRRGLWRGLALRRGAGGVRACTRAGALASV